MPISFVDLATIFAYSAIAADFLIQISRIWRRKSSEDISVVGTTIRLAAGFAISVKLFYLGDIYVSIGQGAIIVLLVVYLALIIRFRKRV